MKLIKGFVVVVFLLVASSCSAKTKEYIGQTDQYSENEIQAAMTTVKEHYKKYVPGIFGCKLKSLTFDEAESNLTAKSFQSYLTNNNSSDKITFISEVRTGIGAGTLSDFSTYSFYWVLAKQKDWKIVYGGFLN